MKTWMGMMFGFAVCVTVLWAAVPQQINYQGYLTRPDGTPLDTTVAMTFALYSDSTAGTQCWVETQPAIPVLDGLFQARLGRVTALTPALLNQPQVWLGIRVGGDAEMTPRTRIVSVGYALRVGTVDGASGGAISGELIADTLYADIVEFADGTAQTTALDTSGLSTRAWVRSMGYLKGSSNVTSPTGFVGGGDFNKALGAYATIGGGGGGGAADSNFAPADRSTIGGGARNQTGERNSTVGGGHSNHALGEASTVSGGYLNAAGDAYSTVSGGYSNLAAGSSSTVGGGRHNRARGYCSVVGGGGGDLPADSNCAAGDHSTIGGGLINHAAGTWATVGGGMENTASGLWSTIGGGHYNKARGQCSVVGGGGGDEPADSNLAAGSYSTVSGGTQNVALNNWTTVGGGINNTADSLAATVGGGRDNTASGTTSTISGGLLNVAAGTCASISGGFLNAAAGAYASISGGLNNQATGVYSIVAGGRDNDATGTNAFAAGHQAQALHDGAFVWGDDTYANLTSTADNQFLARCRGGVYFYSNAELTTGSYLAPGSGTWQSVSDSTQKRNIRLVDTRGILDRVTQLPIKQWSYKSQDPSVEHIGPVAQDFHALFPLGDDPRTISTIDPSGVALAAIQELAKRNTQLEAQVAELRSQLQALLAKDEQTQRKMER